MPEPILNTVVSEKSNALLSQPVAPMRPINFSPIFLNNNIYLFNYVDKARWVSGQLVDADNFINATNLPWMDSDGDSNGFVRLDDAVLMEDNQTYKALRTHPKWVNNGTIKGWLPWVQQNGTGTFKAQVGFLNGAAGTDGVTFQVWVHYHVNGVENWVNVIHQQKPYNGQLQQVSADLSKWANQQISIELRVDAGATSYKDWAAWINPRIEMAPIPVKIPGPVMTNDNPVFFNDRYDVNKKWYFPDFELKQPLKDNFIFSCYKNAEPDENGKPTYGGEVRFTFIKNIPAAIATLVANNAGATYTEIALNNFAVNFVLAFKTKPPVTYSGTVTQTNNDYTLSLKPDAQLTPKDQEAYLLRLFNFISNADNAAFCTLSVTGSYSGYIFRPTPEQFKPLQLAFRLKQVQAIQPINRTINASSHVMMMHSDIAMNNIVAAAQPASEAAIVDHPQDDYIMNGSLPFTKIISNVNYPCAGTGGYPDNYIIKDSTADHPVPFACHPPFGDPAANNYTYTAFSPQNVVLSDYGINNIYLNMYNYNYLIIPEKYTIMLEQAGNADVADQLIPAAYLNTIIDDTSAANCIATFLFHIAPDISAYQLREIKKLIFNNIPVKNKQSIDDITIEFPQTIHQPETIVFDKVKKTRIAFMGSYKYGVQGCSYFQLELQDVNIGDGSAGLIADTIKGQMGGAPMVANISFDIDNATATLPGAAIVLSLNRITGNGLLLQKNEGDNKVYFTNRTFYDVSVTALASDTETIINPALSVPKNNSVLNSASVQAPLPVTADNISSMTPQYTYLFNQDYNNSVLAEMRIDVQNVSDSIIVTNNTGLFSMYNIKQVDITIYILPTGETDFAKALRTIAASIIKDGVINYAPFILPVGTYSSKWSAVYATDIKFGDGSVQSNNVQVVENLNSIGKVINLTASNLNLKSGTTSNTH